MIWYYPELLQRVQAVLPPGLSVQTNMPADQTAWLSVPVFALAKQTSQPLPTVAREVAKKIEALGDVTVEVVGGFVNVTPGSSAMALTQTSDASFGQLAVGNGQPVVVEFSAPNIAKPMGIGHLRSTIIGDALQRVYRALGYEVTSVNHLGDWGTQFGKLMVAYQTKFGDLAPRSLTVDELFHLYVGFHTAAEADATLNDAARAMFKRLEEGDPVVRTLWQTLVDQSLGEFQTMYDRLGIVIDEPTIGESFYEPLMGAIIDRAREQGLAKESAGALVVEVPGETVPLMLKKADGSTIYATRDLAALKYRIDTYQPMRLLYVVANEQSLHFRQVFAVAGLLGLIPDGVSVDHIKFGLVRTAEGKLSTRAGRVVFLNDVLNEAVERARVVVEEKNPDLDDAAKSAVAEAVGIASVKFFDLFHDRNHDIVFDWDRMLSLKGDSAPYLLYSYTRAAGILRKNSEALADLTNVSPQLMPYVRTLARFPLVLEAVVADNAPHHLAQYLNQVATEFHRFYEEFPVLSSKGADRAARLAVAAGTANVLKRGLDLLGISVLETM